MHSIEHALRQVKRHFESLPAWAGPLLAAAGVAAFALVILQWQAANDSAAAGDYLLDGQKFDKSQLGPIMQALAKSELTSYAIEQQRIRVPRGQAARYHAALAAAGALPGDFPSHMRAALEQNWIFESDHARQQRLRHARELDLAMAIRSMEGIDDAMVQLDEIEQRGFQSQRLVTASVSIVPNDGHALDHGQVRAIGRLVAGANAGMRPEDVIVTDLRSGVSFAGGEANDAVGPIAEEYLRVKRAVERSWQQKILQVLSFVPGARVAVDAELGVDPEHPGRPPISLSEPKRLSVSVAVPESYLLGVWRINGSFHGPSATRRPSAAQRKTLHDDTQAQIRDAITGLLPDHIDIHSAVTVTTFHDLARPADEPRSNWHLGSAWRASFDAHRLAWAVVIAGGLIAGAVTWLVRHRPGDDVQSTIVMPSHTRATESPASDHDEAPEVDESMLRATLAELVREDPDGAVEILHRWMDKAG